jgi:VIT1/CCC1 family predicted Fe2+/Mn2+ transporter
MEAFRPKTKDPEQSLADMLASPYVRYRRPLSQKTALEIVGRVDQYEDGTPELAARVLVNSALLEEIEESTDDEDRRSKIDDAIVAAAREAQEEAREARELAEQERQRADEATQAAQERAARAEKRAAEAVAAADAARRTELAGAEARAAEAAKNQEARAAEAITAERERYKRELAAKDSQLEGERKRSQAVRRRLLFFVVFVLAVVAFLLLDLAVGLKSAWAALVALGVLVGLVLGLSQWTRWRSGNET